MKICPNCKNQFPDDAKFCGACGTNISEVSPEQPEPAPKSEESVQYGETVRFDETVRLDVSEQDISPAQVDESVQSAAPAQDAVPEQESVPVQDPVAFPNDDPAQSAVLSSEAKKSPIKVLVILAAAVLMFLIILISVSSLFTRGSDFDFIDNSISGFTNADSESVLVFNTKDVVTLDDTVSQIQNRYEADGAYVLSDGELKLVTKDGETTIDSDVTGFKASIDSETVVYTKLADEEEGTVDLYTWSGKDPQQIDTEILGEVLAVSPNGKNVAYIKDMSDDEMEFDSYISKNGKSGEKTDDEGRAILAISNDAKTTVFLDIEKEDIYIAKGKTETKLGSLSDVTSLTFNEDYSELLFISNQKLYFSKNAGDKQKLANDVYFVTVCVPATGSISSTYTYIEDFRIAAFGTDTFIGKTLYSLEPSTYSGTIFEFDKKLSMTTMKSGVDDYFLTEDEKTLFFTKNGDLYKMKNGKEGSDEKIANDISDYAISANGKKVYYINDDEELCTMDGKKEKSLADDASDLHIAEDGYVYFIEDYEDGVGDLRCLKGTGNSEAVDGGEDVSSVYTFKGKVVFIADYEDGSGNLCVADGKKSKQLAEEIR